MRNDWCVGLASGGALQQCQAGARHGCCKGWSCEQDGEDSDCHELGRLLLGKLKLCVDRGSNIVCVKGGLGVHWRSSHLHLLQTGHDWQRQ